MQPNNPRPPLLTTGVPPMGMMPQGYMMPHVPTGIQPSFMAPVAYSGISVPAAYAGSVPQQYYNQQRAYFQQMAMSQAPRPRQEVPPSGKSSQFASQQQKLKAFGVKGVKTPSVSMDGLIESMFGKTPHKVERKAPFAAQMSEYKESVEQQSMQQPSNPIAGPALTPLAPAIKKQIPVKSLDAMMQECTDITSGVQRSRSFKKKSTPSNNEQKQQVRSVPPQPTSRFPAWCCAENAPPIYLEVERLSSVDGQVDNGHLLPILLSSGLQRELLARIWESVSKEQAGCLSQQELYAALALVALCQAGYQVTGPEVLHMLGTPPVPVFLLPQREEAQSQPTPQATESAVIFCESHISENAVASTEDDEFDDFKQASWDPAPPTTSLYVQPTTTPPLSNLNSDDKYAVFKELKAEDTPCSDNQLDDFGDFLSAGLDNISLATTQDTVQHCTTESQIFSSEQQQQLFEDSFPNLGASIFGATPKCNTPPFQANFADFDAQSPDAFTRSPTNEDSPDEEFGSFTQSGILPGTDSKLGETQSVASLELASGEADLSRHGSSQSLDSKCPGVSLGSSGTISITAKHHQRSVSDGQGLSKALIIEPLEPAESSISLVEDRYSSIRKEKAKTGVSCIQELSSCLSICLRLLEAGVEAFTQMRSTDVFHEVLAAKEALDYIQNVKEIYTVAQRIRASTSERGSGSQLQSILEHIQETWNAFATVVETPQHPSVPSDLMSPTRDFSFAVMAVGADQTQACGVCLLDVDAPTTSCWPGSASAQVKLSYGRRQYHATCANLWLNCVDPILPALTILDLGIY